MKNIHKRPHICSPQEKPSSDDEDKNINEFIIYTRERASESESRKKIENKSNTCESLKRDLTNVSTSFSGVLSGFKIKSLRLSDNLLPIFY